MLLTMAVVPLKKSSCCSTRVLVVTLITKFFVMNSPAAKELNYLYIEHS